MTQRAAIVTGTSGGIGLSIGRKLMENGWFVVGVNRSESAKNSCNRLIRYDLSRCDDEDSFKQNCIEPILDALQGIPLGAIVNNSATQRLAGLDAIKRTDWAESLAVNLTAPMLLSQAFVNQMRQSGGVVLNIGSVHARATKREFVTYATTKAALHGLTRAMAVDLGPEIRVICLAPAAIATPMLKAGFEGKEDAFSALENCHALGRIGSPEEVADAAMFLMSEKASFFSGATVYLDGGVLSKLHDPA